MISICYKFVVWNTGNAIYCGPSTGNAIHVYNLFIDLSQEQKRRGFSGPPLLVQKQKSDLIAQEYEGLFHCCL